MIVVAIITSVQKFFLRQCRRKYTILFWLLSLGVWQLLVLYYKIVRRKASVFCCCAYLLASSCPSSLTNLPPRISDVGCYTPNLKVHSDVWPIFFLAITMAEISTILTQFLALVALHCRRFEFQWTVRNLQNNLSRTTIQYSSPILQEHLLCDPCK